MAAMVSVHSSGEGGGGGEDAAVAAKWAQMFGPGQVDQMIRNAVQFCWMALPQRKRNPKELEKQIRRLVDRALKDFREDHAQFGRGKE